MSIEFLSRVREQSFPDEWYDAGNASHFWFRWRLEVLRHALADAGAALDAPWRVLEVGCGSGVLANQVEAVTRWTVDGTDLNASALERCRPRRGRSLYYDVTEERPDILGRYDAVVLFDVIEHLAEPRTLLRSALQHVRPGGLLLVNVPALPSLTSAYDRAAGHLRRYTRRALARELDGLGVEARVLRYWGMALVPLLLVRKLVLARGGPGTIERGFRPPLRALNSALSALMRVETALVRAPVVGTSVMYVGAKSPP